MKKKIIPLMLALSVATLMYLVIAVYIDNFSPNTLHGASSDFLKSRGLTSFMYFYHTLQLFLTNIRGISFNGTTDFHLVSQLAANASAVNVNFDMVQSKNSENDANVKLDAKIMSNSQIDRPLTCNNCFHPSFNILRENTSICSKKNGIDVDFIVMITSSPSATKQRMSIRDTWVSVCKNNTANIRYVFLLGTTNSTGINQTVSKEVSTYQDIVIFDFVDTYGNLTLKTLAGLSWIIQHCGNSR